MYDDWIEKSIPRDHRMSFDSRDGVLSIRDRETRNRGAAGSSLIGVATLWSLSKTHLS